MCRALNLLLDKQQEINKIRKYFKKIWYRKYVFTVQVLLGYTFEKAITRCLIIKSTQ